MSYGQNDLFGGKCGLLISSSILRCATPSSEPPGKSVAFLEEVRPWISLHNDNDDNDDNDNNDNIDNNNNNNNNNNENS